MARTKLDMPDKYVFSTELTVRISDVNYGGHMGNDALLSLLNEARVRFLREHGFSELDAGGAGLIMSEVLILYKAQAFHGDRLTVDIAVADIEKCGCDILYRVTRKDGCNEVARARTGMIFFDYSSNRIAKTPEKFAHLFCG